jgi:hypothetical protein
VMVWQILTNLTIDLTQCVGSKGVLLASEKGLSKIRISTKGGRILGKTHGVGGLGWNLISP